ncbi:MAG TPA: asparagine synthetase B [Gammaproteobacteria bacterium]|nr:asparagine synthetase B [Gammaproteobacteria bacterium]
MCGIVGLYAPSRALAIARETILAMNQAQFHRGPDEGGQHHAPGLGLGHRRLSIIDLASGQQPLFNEDGTVVVVFNGEIYNHAELMPELIARGHRFRTRCDTEVIVHAWEEWGEKCIERFRGMFAFVLYDARRDCLFGARDRLGVKPLYYAHLPDGSFAFASEMKSLLTLPTLGRTLDPLAVEDYFAYGYVPEPRSIYQEIRKLEPGFRFLHERGGPSRLRLSRYWDVPFEPHPPAREEDIAHELVERLREAVRIRMVAEVPLGAFLSGGVDSSSVVALMAGLDDKPVETCAIAFADPRFDESAHARLVAQRYHTNHHEERVDADDYDLIDRLAACYDEPFADSSALPTWRVCQMARRHVTVALSGDGGDENFAGYRRYRWHRSEERLRALLPIGLRRALFGPLGRLYPKLDWAPRWLRAKSTFEALARDSLEGYFHGLSILHDGLRIPLYTADFRRSLGGYHALEVLREHAGRCPTEDPIGRVQYLDMKTYLPGDILTKVDRASMAHALEVRVPLLDHLFTGWVSGLPSGQKLRGQEGKYIFKKAMEPLLPKEILYRRKMGFAVPVAAWFRGPLKERLRAELLGSGCSDLGIFEPRQVRRLVDDHIAGVRDHSAPLWSLLMFRASLTHLQSLTRPVTGPAA